MQTLDQPTLTKIKKFVAITEDIPVSFCARRMSMEREKWGWTLMLFIALFLSLLHFSFSSDFPSQGCYWSETCLHKLTGDCGGLVYNQSSDCHGSCQSPKYSPCPPDHTYFYCCVAGSPRQVKDGCTKCENKVDDGNEFVCCDDCTYPEMVYDDSSSGYCKSGAELISQPKPKEVFKWVTGPWLACSSPCGGGIRSRRVECFAVVEATSSPDYPVYDDRCSDQEKPVKQEPCNLQRCVDEFVNHAETHQKQRRASTWKVALLIFFGVAALLAIGFAGFIFYTRRTANQQGYVYIMMGEYS